MWWTLRKNTQIEGEWIGRGHRFGIGLYTVIEGKSAGFPRFATSACQCRLRWLLRLTGRQHSAMLRSCGYKEVFSPGMRQPAHTDEVCDEFTVNYKLAVGCCAELDTNPY